MVDSDISVNLKYVKQTINKPLIYRLIVPGDKTNMF
jgi:hypothetical protein